MASGSQKDRGLKTVTPPLPLENIHWQSEGSMDMGLLASVWVLTSASP